MTQEKLYPHLRYHSKKTSQVGIFLESIINHIARKDSNVCLAFFLFLQNSHSNFVSTLNFPFRRTVAYCLFISFFLFMALVPSF
jgi:hypothetical protein